MKIEAETPDEITELLQRSGYISNIGISTALLLASKLNRPLLIEGQPGCGKTSLAKSLADATEGDLVRLQCYRGLGIENTSYEWDHMKQFLRIRIEGEMGIEKSVENIEKSIFEEEYLLERPILRALRGSDKSILLIDELDRAGEEIEAFLLEVLDENQLTIPELGTIKSEDPPIVIITSNRTRKISDALKRRCLYLYLDPPEMDREMKIVQLKVPNLDEHITIQIVEFMQTIRYQENLMRIPGISETLDWAMALSELEIDVITPDVIKGSLSTIIKEPEDLEKLSDDVVEKIIGRISRDLEK
tara:strand:- start:10954 stop:11862 length:909 start_codon:yes stop_codon:yes gene_type:complete